MIYQFLRKQEAFFSSFQRQAALAVEAAHNKLLLVDAYPDVQVQLSRLADIEGEGDQIVNEISQQLLRTFITPIDREDIHSLSRQLDGILDHLHGTAVRLASFHIQSPTPQYRRLVELTVTATTAIGEAVHNVGTANEVSELRRQVKASELESDAITRRAVGELFGARADVYELIKWKELYERMETVLDRCEDVFDQLERLVVKYA